MQKVTLCQFGDVDQAFQAFFNPGKSAKTDHVGDDPFDQLIRFVALFYRLPGIG